MLASSKNTINNNNETRKSFTRTCSHVFCGRFRSGCGCFARRFHGGRLRSGRLRRNIRQNRHEHSTETNNETETKTMHIGERDRAGFNRVQFR